MSLFEARHTGMRMLAGCLILFHRHRVTGLRLAIWLSVFHLLFNGKPSFVPRA